MNLYWLDTRLQAALDNAVDPETGEILFDDDVIQKLAMKLDDEREQVALAIKNYKSICDGIDAERKALGKRLEQNRRLVERLEKYLKDSLKGERFTTA